MTEKSRIAGKAAAGRSERLAAALRENLKRRKVQARARAAAGAGEPKRAGTGLSPQSDGE